MSPDSKKIFASILSWAIMIVLILLIVGIIVYLFESVISLQSGFATSGFSQWMANILSISLGLAVLTVGLIIVGTFLLTTVFILLIKNGQKILLNIITEFEE